MGCIPPPAPCTERSDTSLLASPFTPEDTCVSGSVHLLFPPFGILLVLRTVPSASPSLREHHRARYLRQRPSTPISLILSGLPYFFPQHSLSFDALFSLLTYLSVSLLPINSHRTLCSMGAETVSGLLPVLSPGCRIPPGTS